MRIDKLKLEQRVLELQALRSNDPDVLDELSTSYWFLKRQDEAIATFETLLRQEPVACDKSFDSIYLSGLRITGTCPTPAARRRRLINLINVLQSTRGVDGDVAECGCFLGFSSYMLCNYLRLENPTFDGGSYHVFDSFKGLSAPTLDDEIPNDWTNADSLRVMSRQGYFAASLERVSSNLREFSAINFHPGWIPLSFEGLPEAEYRFVHVDVDLYDPTMDAFNYFYPRLAPGGVITSDDYGWPGARTAIDEFCRECQISCEVTEFNQAIVRKPYPDRR